MNYTSVCRSNYFRVKDQAAFKDSCHESIDIEHDQSGNVAIFADDGWPNDTYNEETGDYDDWDIIAFLKEHLAEGEVALCMEAGNEGRRYVVGHVFIVAWDGRHSWMNLSTWANYKAKAMFGPDFKLSPAEL